MPRKLYSFIILGLLSVPSLLMVSLFSIYITNESERIFWFLMAVSAVSMITPFLWQWQNKSFDVFSPLAIFVGAYFLNHFLKPLDYFIFGERIYASESVNTNILGLLICLMGLYSFYLGYFSRGGNLIAKSTPKVFQKLNYNRMIVVCLVIFLIGLSSLGYIIFSGGGFDEYVHNLNQRVFYFRGKGMFYALCYFMPAAATILYATSLLMYRRYSIFRTVSTVVLFASFVGVALTGSRFNVIWLTLSVLLIRNYGKKRIKNKTVVAVLLALIFFSVLGAAFRKPGQDIGEKMNLALQRDVVSENSIVNAIHLIARQFFPHEEFLLLLDKMPEHLEFQYGKTYLNSFFYFIPSRIFSDKKEVDLSMGKIYSKTFFPVAWSRGVTYSPGVFGESYLNFHLVGVILVMVIMGILFRCLYILLGKESENLVILFLYAISVPLIIRVLKGGISSSSIQFIYMAVPIVICLLLSRTRREKPLPLSQRRWL